MPVKVRISTLRDFAARAGINADRMNAREIREAHKKLRVEIDREFPGVGPSHHDDELDEWLRRAGA